jgi:hypothetical protein
MLALANVLTLPKKSSAKKEPQKLALLRLSIKTSTL